MGNACVASHSEEDFVPSSQSEFHRNLKSSANRQDTPREVVQSKDFDQSALFSEISSLSVVENKANLENVGPSMGTLTEFDEVLVLCEEREEEVECKLPEKLEYENWELEEKMAELPPKPKVIDPKENLSFSVEKYTSPPVEINQSNPTDFAAVAADTNQPNDEAASAAMDPESNLEQQSNSQNDGLNVQESEVFEPFQSQSSWVKPDAENDYVNDEDCAMFAAISSVMSTNETPELAVVDEKEATTKETLSRSCSQVSNGSKTSFNALSGFFPESALGVGIKSRTRLDLGSQADNLLEDIDIFASINQLDVEDTAVVVIDKPVKPATEDGELGVEKVRSDGNSQGSQFLGVNANEEAFATSSVTSEELQELSMDNKAVIEDWEPQVQKSETLQGREVERFREILDEFLPLSEEGVEKPFAIFEQTEVIDEATETRSFVEGCPKTIESPEGPCPIKKTITIRDEVLEEPTRDSSTEPAPSFYDTQMSKIFNCSTEEIKANRIVTPEMILRMGTIRTDEMQKHDFHNFPAPEEILRTETISTACTNHSDLKQLYQEFVEDVGEQFDVDRLLEEPSFGYE